MSPRLTHLLLVLALLTGQAFLAYHGPSHIAGDTDISGGSVLAQDDCHLGGQAHAPALPGTSLTAIAPAAGPQWHPLTDHSHTFNHALRPLARAPPLPA
ncbi:MAG: hypothetical protein ACPG43_08335 [Alcanivoracaceae bacterium]